MWSPDIHRVTHKVAHVRIKLLLPLFQVIYQHLAVKPVKADAALGHAQQHGEHCGF